MEPTEIVLTRDGHYFVPDGGGTGMCQAAKIVKVWTPDMVNLTGWDGNGDAFRHTSVPVLVDGDPERGLDLEGVLRSSKSASFHLSRSCPFGR